MPFTRQKRIEFELKRYTYYTSLFVYVYEGFFVKLTLEKDENNKNGQKPYDQKKNNTRNILVLKNNKY